MTEPKSVKRSAIEHVIYRMPLDGAQGSGQFDPRLFEKTTYDPDLISDERYIELGREAAVDAKRRGELQREWAGEASNGLGFYGYIDDQQRVSYLCARMPRASAHAPALRVQLSDDLFPAQAFFNAVPDSSFVAMVEQLSRGVGHVVNAAGCAFVEEGPEPRSVEFWAQNDEIRLSRQHFRELLRQVCDSQCQQVPEQADQLNALVPAK